MRPSGVTPAPWARAASTWLAGSLGPAASAPSSACWFPTGLLGSLWLSMSSVHGERPYLLEPHPGVAMEPASVSSAIRWVL